MKMVLSIMLIMILPAIAQAQYVDPHNNPDCCVTKGDKMKDNDLLFFPKTSLNIDNINEGITLRDYFASQAMGSERWVNYKTKAKECYKFADAMLEERNK